MVSARSSSRAPRSTRAGPVTVVGSSVSEAQGAQNSDSGSGSVRIGAIAFSRDGGSIATGSEDGTVLVWRRPK